MILVTNNRTPDRPLPRSSAYDHHLILMKAGTHVFRFFYARNRRFRAFMETLPGKWYIRPPAAAIVDPDPPAAISGNVYLCHMSNRIKIFIVDKVRHIRIDRVNMPKPQGGSLILMTGEQLFRIAINPLKLETVKFNVDITAATETVMCEPGFAYVTARTPQQAVQRFNNSITDEHAIKIAAQNGFDGVVIGFPDQAENEKGPEPESVPNLKIVKD